MSYLFFLPLVLYVFPPFSSQPLEWTLHTAKLLQNLSLAYAELQDWNSHSSACSPSPRQPSCSPPSQPQPFLPLRSSAALAAPVSPQPVSCLFSTLTLLFTSAFLVYQNPYHPPGPVQTLSPFWGLPPSSTPTSLRSEWITLLLGSHHHSVHSTHFILPPIRVSCMFVPRSRLWAPWRWEMDLVCHYKFGFSSLDLNKLGAH